MEAYIFPEGLDEKRLAIAKRLAHFAATADMADVLRLDTIIQTTANIRATDAAKEQTDKAG
jgi:hypothetical protein